MLSEKPLEHTKMQMFVKCFMKYITPLTFTLLGAKSEDVVKNEFGKLVTGIKVLNRVLEKSLSTPFVLQEFSLAEVLCASFIIRLYKQLPHFRNIDVIELCTVLGCDRMKDWVIAVCNRPTVIKTTPTDQSLIKNLPPYVKVNYFKYHLPIEEQTRVIESLQLKGDEGAFASLIQQGNKLLEVDRVKRRVAKGTANSNL